MTINNLVRPPSRTKKILICGVGKPNEVRAYLRGIVDGTVLSKGDEKSASSR